MTFTPTASVPDMDQKAAPASKGRLVQLDFLRGIAILLVLIHHTPLKTAFGSITPFVAPLFRFGWSGVDMFFILSGFLVGGLLFSEIAATGRLDVPRFLIRRAFKLWPGYAVFIAYYAAKLIHRGDSLAGAFRALWPNFIHLQNYIHVENPFALAPEHTWSLAVEEHFYLVLPLLLLFLLRDSSRERLSRIPWIAGGLLVVCLALRLLRAGQPFDRYADMFPTHLRIDTLFLGVCLGYFYHFNPSVWHRVAAFRKSLLALGLVLVAPMLWVPETAPFVFTAGYTALALGYACLLIAVVPAPGAEAAPQGLWTNPFVQGIAWVGLYSYSIYLWHQDLAIYPVLHWLRFNAVAHAIGTPLAAAIFLLIGIGVSIFAGWLMGRLIEFPVLRVRERYFAAKAGPLTEDVPSLPMGSSEAVPNL